LDTITWAEIQTAGSLHPLTDAEILRAWESGQARHPLDREIVLLALGMPADAAPETLSALPVGRRDGLLLALRRLTFGPQLESRAVCPNCHEEIEFGVASRTLEALQPETPWPETFEVSCPPFHMRARLPTSRDLASIATFNPDADNSAADAREALLRRCILAATEDGALGAPSAPVDIKALPAASIEELAARILELDPLAEIQLALHCAACDHHWSVMLDIGAFLWIEVEARAQRLLQMVGTLARAYGWSEAAILEMNPVRRQVYLELATS
jgi:hypothetical protein